MTSSLANQPLDIVLLILDVGELVTRDALAFRLVCKALYHVSEHRSFWLSIAKNMQHRHLLPLPPFRSMATLSTEEIRKTCTRHYNTTTNLRSPEPQCRDARILVMESERSAVSFFAFLYGGRYGLIAQENGRVSIWDLHTVLDQDVTAAAARDAPPNTNYTPIPVGKMLASFGTGHGIFFLDYRAFGPEERQIVVTTISTIRGEKTNLNVLEFNFVSDDQVTAQRHYQGTTTMRVAMTALGPYGSVIFFTNHGLDTQWTRLTVLDFIHGHEVLIHTMDMPPYGDFAYDLVATDGGDLLIYMATNLAIEIFAYFDIRGLITSKSQTITLAPHARRTITYSKTCQFQTRSEGSVLHPWNTPNRRTHNQLPLMTSMKEVSLYDVTGRTFGVHWLSIDRLVAHLKSDAAANFVEPVHRTFCHVEPQIEWSEAERELIAFGDSGRSAIWIREPADGGTPERSLRFLPFQSPTDDPTPERGLDLHEAVRTLRPPIVLEGARLLDFCDEAGVLMVVMNGRGTKRTHEQRLHLFQY